MAGYGITCEYRLLLCVPVGDQCPYEKVSVEHQSHEWDAHKVTTRNADFSCERVQTFGWYCVVYHNHIIISITTVHIQMQTHNTKQIHRRLCCSDTNRLLTSWIRFFDTRRETQFLKVFCNHTMLTKPLTFGTSHGPISNPQLYGQTQLLNIMVGTQLNLFQNLPNSQPISSEHDIIHTPASFPVWGDCHILCAWG